MTPAQCAWKYIQIFSHQQVLVAGILPNSAKSGCALLSAVARRFAAAKICRQTCIDPDRITENNGCLAAPVSYSARPGITSSILQMMKFALRLHRHDVWATLGSNLTLSPPTPLRLYTLPYWSNPPFLICDIRALWRSGLSASAPECHKLKMVG